MQVAIDIPDELIPPKIGDIYDWNHSIAEHIAKSKIDEILMDIERAMRTLRGGVSVDNDSANRLLLADQRLREAVKQIDLLHDFLFNYLAVK